ncbi:hypothetical protein B0I35DRAFT_462948 [Stachybotrys elegans]|uniref:Uncharacterized protein n=1 Tax=Stachybotrys elegans TaxID=80388 RepID=A0A8K0SPQ1_9HYPO|nr:hypothetical protein B0I35DRAFT_462948 [Stachybotrys elegans]
MHPSTMASSTLPRPPQQPNKRTLSRFALSRPQPAAEKKRPVISSPLGPVKNSRGPDLVRADTLSMVPTINDCASDARKSRRVSASFAARSGGGRIASAAAPPTVASSDVVVVALPLETASLNRRRARKTPDLLAGEASSFGFSARGRMISTQDENAPPIAKMPPVAASKLPKSRTMSVLQELKTSISRPPPVPPKDYILNTMQPGVSSSDTSSTSTLPPTIRVVSATTCSKPRASRTSLSSPRRVSQTGIPERASTSSSPPISTAQPSAFWAGRFVALRDKYMSEKLDPDVLAVHVTARHRVTQARHHKEARYRPTHLSSSITTSALTSLTSNVTTTALDDDDEMRVRRIFARLHSECGSLEARRSLHEWQQTYARRHKSPSLLPQGGTMTDRTLMARIFGGSRKFSSSSQELLV